MDLYLELSKIEQTRLLKGAPVVEDNTRAKEVQSESCRHGTEELWRQRLDSD